MADTVASRGPDGAGYWSDPAQAISLGHRRLAVIDLSPAGAQPMTSGSGRYVLVFNGEIYNHGDLRLQLEADGAAQAWRGHSDTETLLAGFDAWGIDATVSRSVGMFAFALWDRESKTLTLGRDRVGEKPLYYGWVGKGSAAVFLFGSELKALRAHPAFDAQVDRGALSLLVRHNYIPAPHSIYGGISKLLPGSLLTVSAAEPHAAPRAYWSMSAVAMAGAAQPFAGTSAEAVDRLEALLMTAVGQQMIADVPLGAFLSGGVDSSTVVALMQAQSAQPVKTFTIGFDNAKFNEAHHAKQVAAHLGTDHTELYINAAQALAVIPALPALYDEPFSDSSQIPTFLVSQLARRHVSVSLSGDAGDELFCGYGRYPQAASMWNRVSRLPMPVRQTLRGGLTGIPVPQWNALASLFKWTLPAAAAGSNIGDKIHKGAKLLDSGSCDDLYRTLTSQWSDPASVVINGPEPDSWGRAMMGGVTGLNPMQRMMALDMMTYLPDDILAKVDRAAMGVSLESRVPFLDHRVIEFAWQLPQSMKLTGDGAKWLLRQVLYRHVPKAMIERPKMGFAVPLGDWLRGPLRDWAEALLDEERLRREGFFHPAPIRKKWHELLAGQRNWEHHLWTILMFQAWWETQ